jgi:NAD(P) transhydrogenase subunit alpha
MSGNLPVIVQQATDLAAQSQSLSDKLKDFAMLEQVTQSGGVDPFVFATAIFILACFVGYYVVWKVTPALHTPLMSVTNAISGVIMVGSMLAASSDTWNVASILGLVGVFVASINIFGGFIVTRRMLEMFKKK